MIQNFLQIPVFYETWYKALQNIDNHSMASHGVGKYQSSYEAHDSPRAWALDLSAPVGTPLLSPSLGSVRSVRRVGDKWTEYSGNYIDLVVLTETGDMLVTYSHLDEVGPYKIGDMVHTGSQIGTIGETGKTFGPHVHMEIMWWPSKKHLCPYQVFTYGIGDIQLV